MKPDWKDAPEWARWLAMDEDGCWFWFQNRPDAYHNGPMGQWIEFGGESAMAPVRGKDWRMTLEERPQ